MAMHKCNGARKSDIFSIMMSETSLLILISFLFVIAFVGVNGLVEGAVCLITGAAIAKAVMYSRGKLAARKTNA